MIKKYKIKSEELTHLLLNKQLEKYGVTIADILKLPENKIDDVNWYQYYTFDSEEEFNEWRDFCIDILTTHVTPKLPKKLIQSTFSWIDLMWGLKRNYEEDKIS